MAVWGGFKGNRTGEQGSREASLLRFSGAVNQLPFRAAVAGCYHPDAGLLLQERDDVIWDSRGYKSSRVPPTPTTMGQQSLLCHALTGGHHPGARPQLSSALKNVGAKIGFAPILPLLFFDSHGRLAPPSTLLNLPFPFPPSLRVLCVSFWIISTHSASGSQILSLAFSNLLCLTDGCLEGGSGKMSE